MGADALAIFLGINLFIGGAIAALAAQYAYAHFRPATKKQSPQADPVALPRATREKLLEQSEANFTSVLNKSAVQLEADQKRITDALNKEFQKIGSQVVLNEMARYQATLESLRKSAEATIASAQTDVATHQKDLAGALQEKRAAAEAALQVEIAAEKDKLITQLDAKLDDAVLGLLLETLGHDVDLGSQTKYLLNVLDEHKEELKAGVKA